GGGERAAILDPAAAFGERGASVAAHLKQDLSCPICHDRFHEPVSLLCGHTFCRKCLSWWLERQGVRLGGEDSEEDGGEDEDGGSASNRGSCPACRRAIPSTKLGVNTALRSVMMALYGSEMNQRRLAEEREKRKATGGENGGLHERGNEVVVPFEEEDELRHLMAGKSGDQADEEGGWIRLYAAGGQGGWTDGSYRRGSGCSVALRRNVVLDDVDQRYQLSLSLTRCNYIRNKLAMSSGGASIETSQYGTLDVELCLLSMEEDEVDDSGFPPFVAEGDDDEALVCTGPDRVHSCVESSVRLVQADALCGESIFGSNTDDKVAEVPLSRGMIGRDGSVRFRIDLQKAVSSRASGKEAPRVVKLRFHHVDTGAALELRLPTLGEGEDGEEDEIEFRGVERDGTKSSGYMMDDDGDDDHDAEPNQKSRTENEEAEESAGEEGEVCEICRTGGDLIVCDGGDNEGGCGRAFHLECINLRTLPKGDWICKDCARELGFNVGIKGHEWKDGGETVKASDDEVIELDDVDDRQDEAIELDGSVDERAQGRNDGVIELDDSDDEVKVVLKKNQRPKRNTLEESDSD
ncbi:hypothetical protein THAOC_18861, partial [Thalassiosira oceanica]